VAGGALGNTVADILPYLKGRSFDNNTVQIMGEAFEAAMRGLPVTGEPALVREVLAKRIIEIAEKGERDSKELARRALEELRMSSKR
jgi:hypothetical protein